MALDNLQKQLRGMQEPGVSLHFVPKTLNDLFFHPKLWLHLGMYVQPGQLNMESFPWVTRKCVPLTAKLSHVCVNHAGL